jgi:hypothetical protein
MSMFPITVPPLRAAKAVFRFLDPTLRRIAFPPLHAGAYAAAYR